MSFKALLIALYAVATLFPRLLHLPGLMARVQITELLFFPLLWMFRHDMVVVARPRPLFVLGAALYVTANLLSALWSGTEGAMAEAGARVYLAAITVISVAHLHLHGKDGLLSWWKWGSVGVALFSLIVYAWVLMGGDDSLNYVARIPDYPYFGTVLRLHGPANVFGMFYMLLLPGLFLAYADWRATTGEWWPVAVILLACLATFGKENLLFPIGVMLYEADRHMRYRWLFRGFSIALFAVLMLGTHYIIHPVDSPLQEPGYTSGRTALAIADYEFEETNYTANKRAAWLIGLNNLLLGVGPGQFSSHTEALVETGDYPAHFGRFDPHSAWTGAFAETGLLGLLGLIALVASLIYYRPEQWTVSAVLLLLFLVASVFKDVMNFRGLWVLVGLYLAGTTARKETGVQV